MHLVQKAKRGNDKAFLKIFQQHEESIYRMAFVYVKNQEDALDIVQEVAYQAFKKIHTLKNPEYFKTWLMRITINCALNVNKKNSKIIPLNPEFEEFIESDDVDSTLYITLKDLIETLQDDEKSVVLLKYYQSFTFQEISETLGIPLGTAKSILYRALNKLREEFKEAGMYER